jgi:hypothetical protein
MNNNDQSMLREASISGTLNESASSQHQSYKPYVVGLIILFFLHFIVGAILTPSMLVRTAGNNAPELSLKIGYGVGMLAIFGIAFPSFITLFSLLSKSNRNYYSFFKILCWTVFLTLIASSLFQIIIRTVLK